MRMLAAHGIFSEDGGRFGLTEISDPLRSDAADSVRALVSYWTHPMQWMSWGRLADSVRTGAPAFDTIFGEPHYSYVATHQDDGAVFRSFMSSNKVHEEVARAYDVSNRRLIVDVGGGAGHLLALLLQKNPAPKGILFDKPDNLAPARRLLSDAGVIGQCEIIGGDFFSNIPQGGDLYILSRVVMDWDDTHALMLLEACRGAMTENGRVILIEHIIPGDNSPSVAHLSDLMLLVITGGGRVRSELEYDELLAAAHLKRTISIVLPSGYCILEVGKA
jgi:hypothetical protein